MRRHTLHFLKCLQRITHNSGGFSLLEILVAAAIASIILLMVGVAYTSALRSIKDVTGYAEFHESINLAFSKIDRDISNAYYDRDNKKICFIGDFEGENSNLNFITTDYRKMHILGDMQTPVNSSDIREVGYYLKADTEYPGLNYLIRREQRHYDGEPMQGGLENILLKNVVLLKFEFKKRNSYTSVWDSRRTKRFPKAVKITIKLKNYRNVEEEFTFLSMINIIQRI